MVWLTRVCPVAWRFERVPKVANGSSPYKKMETGENEPTTAASLCLVSQKECMSKWRKIIEPKQDDNQCCFRRYRSTTEQISTLQQIFEKS